jgi:CDGSH-type Zn-finger protein
MVAFAASFSASRPDAEDGVVTTIRLRRNGPYVVEGDDVKVVDWNGAEYVVERKPIALCRCGASTKKPFCDGTHSKIGFDAAEAAVGPEAKDKPAGEGRG